MKGHILSFVCAFALLFTACSKEEPATPKEEEKYPVTFKVNSLSHDIVPMSDVNPARARTGARTSGENLPEAINYIFYYAFHEDGRKVQERVQHASEPRFGQLVDLFGKGKYTVLVVGRKQATFDSFWDYNESNWFTSPGLIDEVFFKKVDLVVEDSDVEQEIVLQRKSGMIEIDILGDIPLNVGEIRYSITGVSDHFIPKTNRGDNNKTVTRSMYFEEDGTPYKWDGGEPFTFYFFLDNDRQTTATVRLSAFDRAQNVVAVKVIEDIPVAVNKKTMLRGRLFETTGTFSSQAFSVSF